MTDLDRHITTDPRDSEPESAQAREPEHCGLCGGPARAQCKDEESYRGWWIVPSDSPIGGFDFFPDPECVMRWAHTREMAREEIDDEVAEVCGFCGENIVDEWGTDDRMNGPGALGAKVCSEACAWDLAADEDAFWQEAAGDRDREDRE